MYSSAFIRDLTVDQWVGGTEGRNKGRTGKRKIRKVGRTEGRNDGRTEGM